MASPLVAGVPGLPGSALRAPPRATSPCSPPSPLPFFLVKRNYRCSPIETVCSSLPSAARLPARPKRMNFPTPTLMLWLGYSLVSSVLLGCRTRRRSPIPWAASTKPFSRLPFQGSVPAPHPVSGPPRKSLGASTPLTLRLVVTHAF